MNAAGTPSSSAGASTRRVDIGSPPRLPLSVAAQVAWSSIRARATRSLVTASSVVLAVAFVLAVVGERIALTAMHDRHHSAMRPAVQVQALHDLLARPRPALALIALLADPDRATLEAWQRPLTTRPLPTIAVPVATDAVALAQWVTGLSPVQSYLITRTRSMPDWLLALDSSGAVDSLISTTRDLRGTRLPVPEPQLRALAASLPTLRQAVAQLADAETARLALVAKAGGADAVLARLRDEHRDSPQGEVQRSDGARLPGLPLFQVLPGLGDDELAALRNRLGLDHLRERATKVMADLNRVDPSLLESADISDWPAFGQLLGRQLAGDAPSPAKRLRRVGGDDGAFATATITALGSMPTARTRLLNALNTALASPLLWDSGAWSTVTLPVELRQGLRQDPARLGERRLTRLNRHLLEATFAPLIRHRDAAGPYEIGDLADPTMLDAPVHASLQRALTTELGVAGLMSLSGDLRQRADLATLDQTFAALGFDPGKGAGRAIALAALSLLVCTVGIVNAMMMTVTERFREIATMKCLGAGDGFILKAFLIEASTLGLAGSLAGLGLGLVLVLTQAWWRFGGAFWAACPLSELTLATLAALLCGVVLAMLGALLPAWSAARMHPVDAMRVDA